MIYAEYDDGSNSIHKIFFHPVKYQGADEKRYEHKNDAV